MIMNEHHTPQCLQYDIGEYGAVDILQSVNYNLELIDSLILRAPDRADSW